MNEAGDVAEQVMAPSELSERIAAVRQRIVEAAARAGRDPAAITLLGVTKEHPAELVIAAFEAGLPTFGENRVEEAIPKIVAVESWLQEHAGPAPRVPAWHMLGHLQSRKAAQVIPWAKLVHSVDSEKLARRLNTFAAEAGHHLPILLEVNVSGEASKYGLPPAELPRTVETVLGLPGLELQGLMTVAPIAQDAEEVRPVFAATRMLLFQLAERFPEADWRHLSMGMTDDYQVAIEEGATIVRIGRAIFGERTSCRMG